jgi:hypothetical protein
MSPLSRRSGAATKLAVIIVRHRHLLAFSISAIQNPQRRIFVFISAS